MINITESQRATIMDILRRFVPASEIRVYGSRISGKIKPWSDIDIAILGPDIYPLGILAETRDAFQESDLPFRVDIQDWHRISKEFQSVIEEKGFELMV